MENILQGLHEIEGVQGAMILDGSGQIVAHRTHSMYDIDLLQQVSRSIAGAIDAIKLVQEDWESITTHFSEGKLLIRNMAPGGVGPAFTFTVIADARLNPSFATVAIRVAMGKLKVALQGGPVATASASGNKSAPKLPGGSSVGGVPPVSASLTRPLAQTFSQVKAPMIEVAASGLSWSGFGDSAVAGSGVSVADPASSEFLTACTKALAKSVGPMAKLFVKEAVRKVCPDRPFSRNGVEALVTELVKSIQDPASAAQFQKNMLKAL